jgi:uncharacterized membrane protein HdeD (DUF308 family)
MSSITPSPQAMAESIRSNSGWFLALGVIFIVGGVFAIATPFIATLLVSVFIGVVLAIVGIMQIVQAWSMRSWGGFLWQIIMGLVILAGGIATYISPDLAALWLTLFVAGVFLAKGALQILLGLQTRPHEGSGWIVFAGGISILVGLMILLQWPLSAVYALGVLAGISFIFTGWSYVMLALAARRLAA